MGTETWSSLLKVAQLVTQLGFELSDLSDSKVYAINYYAQEEYVEWEEISTGLRWVRNAHI